MNKILFSLGALVFASTLLVGCGPNEPIAVEVSGTVTLNGQPMTDGKITFFPPGEGPTEMDIVNGSFTGKAKEGLNVVRIGQYVKGPVPPSMPDMEPPLINTLPPRYNTQSTLDANVKTGGENKFTFELTNP